MKTLFLLLIIYNLQNYVFSYDASTIIYRTYPKKVHRDHDNIKVINAGSFYKKKDLDKTFTRFQPPVQAWPAKQAKAGDTLPQESNYFPLDFTGDLQSRVKKLSYFKDARRSRRAANETKAEDTLKTSVTEKTDAPKPKEVKATLVASPKNATANRRSAVKNLKAPVKLSPIEKGQPKKAARQGAAIKSSRLRNSQGRKRSNRKRVLRKRKSRSRALRAGNDKLPVEKEAKGKSGSDKAAKGKAGNDKVPKGKAGKQDQAPKGKAGKKAGKAEAKRRAPSKRSHKGRRPVGGRRLISARDAKAEDYPYVVSIQKDNQHWCSGAILNPQLIVSTANCFWKSKAVSRMKVRAGAQSIDAGGQVAYIAEVRKHPSWSIRKLPQNDIALALLDRQFKFSDAVHGVDLPNKAMIPPFDDAWVTSYGAERRDGVYNRLRMTLQVTYMKLMPEVKCEEITKRFGAPLHESFFCLEQIGRRAPCTRDTGAPAVSDGILWGLASWGIRKLCGTQRYPAMFTYVASSSNIDFIVNATSEMMGEERKSPFLDRPPIAPRARIYLPGEKRPTQILEY